MATLPQGGTVLVVDDEEVVRHVAGLLLESAGYRVLTAGNADEARVLAASADELDAVLLDVMLPGEGSGAVAADLRRIRPGVPIVVSSGYDEVTVSERVGELADVQFLRKPYAADDLMAALAAAIAA
ncbi:MAG TPA: response regulator [Gaiellaceae bacterium]|jgi:CheY-like chemotaxis protein